MKRSEVLTVLSAMQKEIKRSEKGLMVPGHPKPYYLSYLVKDSVRFTCWARYGAIWQRKSSHTRKCFADVRVGSYRYDHVMNGGLNDNSSEAESYDMIDMPIEQNEDALRFALWRLTDAKYREAVAEYYARKSRDLSYLDANKSLASFSQNEKNKKFGNRPQSSFNLLKKQFCDFELVSQRVKRLSLVFKKFPEIKNSYVEFSTRHITKLNVNSEGVQRVWEEPIFELIAHFWFLGKDNEDQSITVAAMARHFADLPSEAEMRKRIKEKIKIAYATAAGESLNSYAGPVLLCPRAAGLFLHEAVGHRLESSRFLSDNEGRSFKDKIGKKVMHEDISMYDDPSLTHYKGVPLIGTYPFDDEGTPSQRAELVRDGKLRGFLSTRSPFKSGRHESNGHARNATHERPMSRMANLIVESKSQLTWSDLKQKLIDEVKRRKLPFGIVLEEVEGGETGTEAYDFQAFLGEITAASKIFPDGTEVPIRGVDFVGTPLACLNQILAVGGEPEVDNGYCGAESGMVPVSTVAPAMLLANLELQSKDPTKVTHYVLPLPWFDEK